MINEETLYNKQLEYLNRLDKKYEAMSYNSENDKEFYNEIKKAMYANNKKREELIKEGKPKLNNLI